MPASGMISWNKLLLETIPSSKRCWKMASPEDRAEIIAFHESGGAAMIEHDRAGNFRFTLNGEKWSEWTPYGEIATLRERGLLYTAVSDYYSPKLPSKIGSFRFTLNGKKWSGWTPHGEIAMLREGGILYIAVSDHYIAILPTSAILRIQKLDNIKIETKFSERKIE